MANIINEKLNQDKNSKRLDRIRERFREKRFSEKYKFLSNLSKYSSYLFNTISILAGFLFVYSLLFKSIPITPIASVLAVLLLLLIELSKRYTNRVAITDYLSTKKLPIALILAIVGLLSLSVIVSTLGAKEGVKLFAKKEGFKVMDYKPIESKANKEVKLIEGKIKALIDRNTYKGKTWLPLKERALNDSYERQIIGIKKRLNEKIAFIEAKNRESERIHSEKTEANIFYIVVLACINEVLCIICLLFPLYYDFRELKEVEIISNSDSVTFSKTDLNDVFALLKNVSLGGSNFATIQGSNVGSNVGLNPNEVSQIGFKFEPSIDEEKRRIERYLSSYRDVVDDMRTKSERDVLSTVYRIKNKQTNEVEEKLISRSTYYNIKRVARQANILD